MMKTPTLLSCLCLAFATGANAQSASAPTPMAASAPTLVPALVPYAGIALSSDGKPLAGEGLGTFLLYKDEKGGEPLWIEAQTVAIDPTGHYQVKLGSSSSNGLPLDTFASGEVRWLEVQIAGQPTGPRTLLTSVPYAMKAADAATLGGLPPSAFVLASAITGIAPVRAAGITQDASALNVTTTGGTNFYIPRFNAATTIINSQIYDNGTSVGIGDVPNASARLDVNGPMIMRGNMTVSRTGNATASTGYPSYGFQFFSSVYNSSSGAIGNPYFQLQSEPMNNDTASPAATFHLLFANNGSAAAETGLYINPDGTIHFVSGQKFVSYPASGTPISASSINDSAISGHSTNNDGISGATEAGTAGFAGVAGVAGSPSYITAPAFAGVLGDSHQGIGVLGTSNSNSGVQGISNSATGVAGTSSSGDGVLGYTGGGTLNTAGVTGQAGGTSGFTGIAGVWGDASAHVGVFGSSNQYAGVIGFSTNAPAVQGVGTNGPGIQGSSTGSSAGMFTISTGLATVYATNTASKGGSAVNGNAYGTNAMGVYGYAAASGGVGVQGRGDQGNGVFGSSGIQAGVYGVGEASATTFSNSFSAPVGVWGDTTGSNGIAVAGTATDSNAAFFSNNSSQSATLNVVNYGSGGTNAGRPSFEAFQASTKGGTCGFGGRGDITCTGQLKSLATTAGGGKTVETYSMQSPENWMEDFGSGTLQSGVSTITIEAGFAETVSSTADYHVFLTPNGDCKGLFIFAKTATSFEVRELGGGTSTIGFDYRIVARRRGFESQRMVDVTEAMKSVNARNTETFARAAKMETLTR